MWRAGVVVRSLLPGHAHAYARLLEQSATLQGTVLSLVGRRHAMNQHISCEGCELNRAGRCHDRTVYGVHGGDLLTDDQTRHCYQVDRTVLLTNLQNKATPHVQAKTTDDLWCRIRHDLKLLKEEYLVLDKDTTDVVDWLKVELLGWGGIGKADLDDD